MELSPVQQHYTQSGVRERLDAALGAAGLGTGLLSWAQIAPLDQFHVRALPASRELAAGLGVSAGQSVLDVGSGLGGPARFLAAEHGAQVTGIEITPIYVEIAQYLSERTGLAHVTKFVEGDALELPFADGTFDHVWTQHVAMNIADKARLYAGIVRVLKPGGRFAIYDVVAGDHAPVIYPVPWAGSEALSFLVREAELLELLRAAGFSVLSGSEKSKEGLEWFEENLNKAKGDGPKPLSLAPILGPEAPVLTGNVARNLREGRIRLLQVIAQKGL